MAVTESEFEVIRTLVERESAIVLEKGKEYLIEARLVPLARAERMSGLAELVEKLQARPARSLVRRVVEAMTTNETTFFRDVHPFEALKDEVLPDVIRRNAERKRVVIWSAAASTGQEAFSIAMLIREYFPALNSWEVSIIATDLSEEVLARAALGRYSQLEVNRGLPEDLLKKYFIRSGLEWQLQDSIKSMVQFRQLNLSRPWGGIPIVDAVFLRNVLIYFDVRTKGTILQRIADQMRAGGWLFLGAAETTHNLCSAFERAPFPKASCYQLTKT